MTFFIGDIIIKEGTIGTKMYFIQEGVVDIVMANGEVSEFMIFCLQDKLMLQHLTFRYLTYAYTTHERCMKSFHSFIRVIHI